MEVYVSGIAGALCTATLAMDATLGDLQRAIEAQTGISVRSQRLVIGNRELTGWDGLGSCALIGKQSWALPIEGNGRIDLLLVRRSPEQFECLRKIEELSPFVVLEWLRNNAPAALEDREIVLAAVAKNSSVLRHASSELRMDRKFVLAAAAQSKFDVDNIALELLADRDFVLALVQNRPACGWSAGKLMGRVAPALRSSREVALAVVALDAATLSFFSPEVRADREVVLAAVANTGSCLSRVHPKFRADREVILTAVAQNGHALQHAVAKFRGDREVVLVGLAQNGHALQHAAFSLQADREVVLAAVAQNESALEHAAPELKADRQFVLSISPCISGDGAEAIS